MIGFLLATSALHADQMLATAIVVPMVDIAVINPNIGSFYQLNSNVPVTLSLSNTGVVSSSAPGAIQPLPGSGATAGVIAITNGTGAGASVSIVGPASGSGNFLLTGPDSNSLNARLYQSQTQTGSLGTLVTDGPFPCIYTAGACNIYLGAQVDIPPRPITAETYTSSAMSINVSF